MQNKTLSLVFIILIFLFNPYTWIQFFDQDGYLKFASKLIILGLDLFFFISAIFFYSKRNNPNNQIVKYIKLASFNSAGILLCVVVLELIFGDWVGIKNNLGFFNNLAIKKNTYQLYNVDPLYDNDNKKILYKRDKFGLRGSYKKLKDIDILTMGGSTTDQRFIDEEKTWQEVLHKKSHLGGQPIYLANAGVDGQSTYGHIKAIQHWLSKIEDLKPKYYLFYLGVNDVWKDTIDLYSKDKILISDEKTFFERSIFWNSKIILNSIFDDRVRHIKHGNFSDNENNEWVDYGLLENYSFINPYLREYKKRLITLNKLVQKNGSKTIIVTNTNNLFKTVENKIMGKNTQFIYHGKMINGVDYGHIYKLFHETARLFCAENDIIFFNLAQELVFNYDEDFYDTVHNTPSGTQKIGHFLYHSIKNINLDLN